MELLWLLVLSLLHLISVFLELTNMAIYLCDCYAIYLCISNAIYLVIANRYKI